MYLSTLFPDMIHYVQIIFKLMVHVPGRRDGFIYSGMFVRLWLVATGHQVGQQIQVVYHQVLKLVHLLSLGITDMTGGGITVHMTAYEQLRSQMMKKIPHLFLVRLVCR
jgi:hypothetical protein